MLLLIGILALKKYAVDAKDTEVQQSAEVKNVVQKAQTLLNN